MDKTVIIALIAGLSGLATTVLSILWAIIKQRLEKKKLDSAVNVDTSAVANNLVDGADTLTGMYRTSLQECRDQIVLLEAKLITLTNKVDENQKQIDILLCKDRNSEELIYRLIQGIRILIQQMKDANIIPVWNPTKADLEHVKPR